MAIGTVTLPPDSTGKIIDTSELTINSKTAERQNICVASTGTAGNIAEVSGSKAVLVSTDGIFAATYRAALAPFSAGTGATTDIANLTGSATKTIRVTKVTVSSTTATAAVYYDLQLLKTSTASSGGTPVAGTVIPLDSGFAAGTATAQSFTAAPTAGTKVANVDCTRVFSPISGTPALGPQPYTFEFGRNGSSALVLRGIAQQLSVQINGVTPSNAQTWNIMFEWVEDAS